MNLYIDCLAKTFSTVAPENLEARTVISQSIPASLALNVVLSLLSAFRVQAEQGVDIVYIVAIGA